MWDIHSIFFYLKEYFMALSMEYNIAQMSAAASLGDTYSGGPIFDDDFRMTFSHKSGWICWMAFVMLTLRASIALYHLDQKVPRIIIRWCSESADLSFVFLVRLPHLSLIPTKFYHHSLTFVKITPSWVHLPLHIFSIF